MKIVIGADHGGFELKNAIAASFADADFMDVGCSAAESCDYPDFADAVAEAVAAGKADFGVLVCTTGMGMSMASNRFQNVRAALCRDEEDARIARATTARMSSASARSAPTPPPPSRSSRRLSRPPSTTRSATRAAARSWSAPAA